MVQSHHHIFFDPTGRRKRLISIAAVTCAAVILIATLLFAATLILHPLVPSPSALFEINEGGGATPYHPHQQQLSSYLLRKAKSDLDREIQETSALSKRVKSKKLLPEKQVVAAFFSSWQETGVQSLQANAPKLTHIVPEWLHLNATGDALDLREWSPDSIPETKEVLTIAKEHSLQIFPRLNNIADGAPDRVRARALLSSPLKQKMLAHELRTWLLAQGYHGVVIDLYELEQADEARLPPFFQILRDEFKGTILSASVAFPANTPTSTMHRVGALADLVFLYSFDEHYSSGSPGPLASLTWFANAIQRAASVIPASKIITVFANHGIDWKEDSLGSKSSGEYLPYLSTLGHAKELSAGSSPEDFITLDPVSLTPFYRYQTIEGESHIVWFLDATSSFNQITLARRGGLRGIGMWNVGGEDPSVWGLIDPLNDASLSASGLSTIKVPYQVDFQGRGEVLSARYAPNNGERSVSVDAHNNLITSVVYHAFPSAVIIERTGFHPKKVALTFDDGPSDEYTEPILDILKEAHVHASFFIVGQFAQRYPEIVQRMYREGHDIGNHTYTHPDLSAVGEERKILELNTTQRALQSIVGHSTTLFRAPYRADAEPKSLSEVKAIQTASALNYMTVGMTVDPQDWLLWNTAADGTRTKRTSQEIVTSTLEGLKRGEGSVVLLHDGGGNRNLTIEALPTIIKSLKKEGYRIESVSELLGLQREQVMPAVKDKDLVVVGFNRFMFDLYFTLVDALEISFTVVLIFGVSRLIFITVLALIGRIRERYQEFDPTFTPPVSAIVAAYNEEKVITHTISSLLQSDYPTVEVVVVDDGSSDATSEVVRTRYKDDPRVTLITQANTGKAGALNHGIERAKYDILVCLDADTQLAPDAIAKMVRHFADPEVGAVAGNVKVGNRENILTQWQSIEYISSQNLDRRAYSLLNAITVVPGAAGAWRRSAVVHAGLFLRDTLAEDMDLTWRLRRLGWYSVTESDANGYTEAPNTVRALLKQRFRWSFGSLQCLWKHRSALFRYGWFGWLGLPTLWLFQIGSQVLAPIVDLQLVYALIHFCFSLISKHGLTQDWQPFAEVANTLIRVGSLYLFLFLCDLVSSIIAFRLDKERIRPLWLLFFQRFAYRQLMYAVVWKSLWTALSGLRQGWGKLQRTGSVKIPLQGALPSAKSDNET